MKDNVHLSVVPWLFMNMFDMFHPIALRKVKIAYNFGLSECSRVNYAQIVLYCSFDVISDLFPPGSVTPMLTAAKKCFHTAAYGAWDNCKFIDQPSFLFSIIQLNFNGSNTFGTMKICSR